MENKKGLVAEFKEFITKGSVMDMAVGIIIGAAFTAIINSLVNDLIMPIVGYLVGGVNFTEFSYTFPSVIPGREPATIMYGAFIQQVISFLIIAFTVFMMVKGINALRRRKKEEPPVEAPVAPEPSAELQMLTEIRDLLKK